MGVKGKGAWSRVANRESLRLLLAGLALFLAQRLALQLDAISVVNQAVQDATDNAVEVITSLFWSAFLDYCCRVDGSSESKGAGPPFAHLVTGALITTPVPAVGGRLVGQKLTS